MHRHGARTRAQRALGAWAAVLCVAWCARVAGAVDCSAAQAGAAQAAAYTLIEGESVVITVTSGAAMDADTTWHAEVVESGVHFTGAAPLGCFTSGAVASVEGQHADVSDAPAGRADPVYACKRAADALGYQAFGLDSAGACYSAADAHSTFDANGEVFDCAADGLGGTSSLAMYMVEPHRVSDTVVILGSIVDVASGGQSGNFEVATLVDEYAMASTPTDVSLRVWYSDSNGVCELFTATVAIIDSLAPAVAVISSGTGQEEALGTASVALLLGSRPLGDELHVTHDVAAHPLTVAAQVFKGAANPALYFPAGDDWSLPIEDVLLDTTGVSDDVAFGSENVQVVSFALHGGANEALNGLVVESEFVVIDDVDVPGMTVALGGSAVDVVEGGVQTLEVQLATRPIGPVTVELTAAVAGVAAFSPSKLLFSQYNWDADTPQVVTIIGVEDDSLATAAPDAATLGVTLTATSHADPVYAGGSGIFDPSVTYTAPTGSVDVDMVDNDFGGLSAVYTDFAAEGDIVEVGVLLSTAPLTSAVAVAPPALPTSHPDMPGLSYAVPSPSIAIAFPVSWAAGGTRDASGSVQLGPDAWGAATKFKLKVADDDIDSRAAVLQFEIATSSLEGDFYNTANLNVAIEFEDDDFSGLLLADPEASLVEGAVDGTESASLLALLASNPGGDLSVAASHAGTAIPPSASAVALIDGALTVAVPGGLSVDATADPLGSQGWGRAFAVTVTAVDDAIALGVYSGHVLTVAAEGGPDGSYDTAAGTFALTTPVTVADDDIVGVTLDTSFAGFTGEVVENEPTATSWKLQLNSQPFEDVTVIPEFTTDAAGAAHVPLQLVFTPSNWNVSQDVSVTINDDHGTATVSNVTSTHLTLSYDLNYDDISTGDIVIDVLDDDFVGLTSLVATAVDEGTSGHVMQLMLASALDEGATANLNTAVTGTQPQPLIVTTGAHTIAAADSFVAVEVGLGTAGIDDHYWAVVYRYALEVTGDAAMNNMVLPVTVGVTDLTPRGVEGSGGSVTLAKGGSAEFGIQLHSRPQADTSVLVAIDAAHAANDYFSIFVTPRLLVFTPDNWSTNQTFVVSAESDHFARSGISGDANDPSSVEIEFLTASVDTHYDGLASTATAVLYDDAFAGLFTVHTPVAVEDTADAITVAFGVTSQPKGSNLAVALDVDRVEPLSAEVALTSGDDVALFGTADDGFAWSSVVTATYTTGDDAFAWLDGTAVHHATLGPIAQNDTVHDWAEWPTISSSFWVQDTDVLEMFVNLTGAVDGGSVGTVAVDGDVAPFALREGGEEMLRIDISFSTPPVADMTLTVEEQNPPTIPEFALDIYNNNRVVTLDNWDSGTWTVYVSLPEDTSAPGATRETLVNITLHGDDGAYAALGGIVVPINVYDDDFASMIGMSNADTSTLFEADTADVTVLFGFNPMESFTATMTAEASDYELLDGSLAETATTPTLDVASFAFTSATWTDALEMTITIPDDPRFYIDLEYAIDVDIEADAGNAYEYDHDSFGATVFSTLLDDSNDAPAAVAHSESGGVLDGVHDIQLFRTLNTVEFPVVLTQEPLADVTVTLTAVPSVPEATFRVANRALVFTAADFDTPQSALLSAPASESADPFELQLSFNATSADPAYHDIVIDVDAISPTASVFSASFAGVAASADELQVAEDGGVLGFNVSLTSQPGDAVVNSLSVVSPVGAILLQHSPAQVTLGDTAEWWQPKEVTLTATPDDLNYVESNVQLLLHSLASTDPEFDGFGASVPVLVVDDDVSLIVAEDLCSMTLVEGETGACFSLVLSSEPFDTVIVDLTSSFVGADEDVWINPPSLTFTPSDWNLEQTVTVNAIDDDFDEGVDVEEIDIIASLDSFGDANYARSVVTVAQVHVVDNDEAGIVVDNSTLASPLIESTSSQISAVLLSEPEEDAVVVSVSVALSSPEASSRSVRVVPSQLVFRSDDWHVQRTIQIFAADDRLSDEDAAFSLEFDVVTDDTVYSAHGAAPVAVLTADDDVDGVAGVVDDRALDEAVGEALVISILSTPVPHLTIDAVVTPEVSSHGAVPLAIQSVEAFVRAEQAHLVHPSLQAEIEIRVTNDHTDSGAQPPQDVEIHLSSAYPPLDGLVLPPFTVQTVDDDFAGTAVIARSDAVLVESERTVQLSLGVTSQPIADVRARFRHDITPGRLRFVPSLLGVSAAPAAWTTWADCTVRVVDDPASAATASALITVDTNSSDVAYDQPSLVPSVPVNVWDADFSGLTALAGAPVRLVEGSSARQALDYNVTVASLPSAEVTLAVTGIAVEPTEAAPVTVGAADVTVAAEAWEVPVPLQVAVVDDFIDWSDAYEQVVRHSGQSDDEIYNGATVFLPLTVFDDDNSTISVDLGQLTVTEAAPAQHFQVWLDSMPFADVTIIFEARWASSGFASSEVQVTPPSLTFSAGDWDEAQEVRVAFEDNDYTEPVDKEFVIYAEAQSVGDPQYVQADVALLELIVTDDDLADVLFNTSGIGETVIFEDTNTLTFSYWLSGRPLHGFTSVHTIVTQTSPMGGDTARQLKTMPETHVFADADDWNSPRHVELVVPDDVSPEGTVSFQVSFAMTASSPGFDELASESERIATWSFTVATQDNDFAGVAAVLHQPGVSLVEDGAVVLDITATTTEMASASERVWLTRVITSEQDTSGVLVLPRTAALAANDSLAMHPSLGGDITVRTLRNDDSIADVEFDISFEVSSSQANMDGLKLPPFSFVDVDDDVAGLVMFGLPATITEGVDVVQLFTAIASQPASDVTASFTFNRVSLFPSSSVYTALDWTDVQAAVVTVPFDYVADSDEQASIEVVLASEDDEFDGQRTETTTFVGDSGFTGGATVAEIPFDLVEGATSDSSVESDATNRYTLFVASQPTELVTVSVEGRALNPASVDPVEPGDPSFTIRSEEWMEPLELWVSVVDDARDWGEVYSQTLLHAFSSSDAKYDGLVVSRFVEVHDDDISVIDVTPLSVSVEEGASGTFQVKLTSEPHVLTTVSMTINHVRGVDSTITLSTYVLTYTPGATSWDDWATVTVTALQDDVDEPDTGITVDLQAAVSDGDQLHFHDVIQSVGIEFVDDDQAGVMLLTSNGLQLGETSSVGESDSIVMQAVLMSEPKTDVQLQVRSVPVDAAIVSRLSLSVESLEFTADNWATPQEFSVGAVNDDVDEPSVNIELSVTAVAADPVYNASSDSVSVLFVDDDAWGFTLRPVLNGNVSPGGTLPSSLSVAEGGRVGFGVELDSEPKADVRVSFGVDHIPGINSTLIIANATVHFGASNWSTPQLVWIDAAEDFIDEADTGLTTWMTSESADPNYDFYPVDSLPDDRSLLPATVEVVFVDNDVAGITASDDVVISEGYVDEESGESYERMEVVLDSQPEALVYIEVAAGNLSDAVVALSNVHDGNSETHADLAHAPGILPDELRIFVDAHGVHHTEHSTILVFSPTDWAEPQNVTISANEDDIDMKHEHQQVVELTAYSSDPVYDGRVDSVMVTIIDDTQDAAIDLFPLEVTVVENGVEEQFDVRLVTQPIANVTIAFSRLAGTARATDVGLGSTQLVFSPTDWFVAQSVPVWGVDNDKQESTTREMTVVATSGSQDPRYDGIATYIPVVVLEDDEAGLTINPEFIQVSEDGLGAQGSLSVSSSTYALSLASEPESLVIVSLREQGVAQGQVGQISISPTSVNFQPEQWDVPTIITVKAVMDKVAEEAFHQTAIEHRTVAGLDPRYDGHVFQSVVVAVQEEAPPDADTTPPPRLVSARLSETAHLVTVVFDRPTNRGGMTVGVDYKVLCRSKAFFSTATLGSFRNVERSALDVEHDGGPYCYWSTSSILAVELEPGYYLLGGEAVTLRGGNIGATPTATLFAEGSVALVGRAEPPRMVGARFGNFGATVDVIFSGTTSGYVAGVSTAPCSQVFQETTLGIGASCRWASSTVLRVTLGTAATIVPHEDASNPNANGVGGDCYEGSRLTLRPNAVKAVRNGIRSSSGCASVAEPLAGIPADAVITAPDQVGSCDDVVLRSSLSTGSGGRPLQMFWSFEAVNAEAELSADIVNDIVEAANSGGPNGGAKSSVTIPALLIEPNAVLSFSLTASNFFTSAEDVETAIVVKKGIPIPFIEIQGAAFKFFQRDRFNRAMATATVPLCNADGETTSVARPMSYVWRHLNTIETERNGGIHETYDLVSFDPNHESILAFQQGGDPKVLRFPPQVLRVGHIVELELEVFMVEDPEVSNVASFAFEVLPSPVQASIVGGSRLVGSSTPTLLDGGSATIDPDAITDAPFRYSWRCEDLSDLEEEEPEFGGTCMDFRGADGETLSPLVLSEFAINEEGSKLRFPANALPFGSVLHPRRLQFTLDVEKGTAGELPPYHYRADTTSIVLSVANGSPANVEISSSGTNGARRKMNAQTAATMWADVESANPSSVVVAWSVSGPGIDGDVNPFTSPVNRLLVRTAAHAFLPGADYTFRVDTTDDNGISFSELILRINEPPTSGYIDISPRSGLAALTEFTVSALLWTDDVDDMPLSYQFAYENPNQALAATPVEVALGTFEENNEKNVLLPRGRGDESRVVITAQVRDNLGAKAKARTDAAGETLWASVSIEALSVEESVALVVEASNDRLAESLAAGNIESYVADLSVYMTVINDGADACSGNDCNGHGDCVQGVCYCHSGSGYSGPSCGIPPPPVDGGWGEWGAWTPCSTSCGGGERRRSRVCNAPEPEHNGLDCSDIPDDGDDEQVESCNTQECAPEPVDGGYTEWGEWSACDAVCLIPGEAEGTQARLRTCSAPSPSPAGLSCIEQNLGLAFESRECSIDCPAPRKLCPGRVLVVVDDGVPDYFYDDGEDGEGGAAGFEPVLAEVPCSNNGRCLSSTPLCLADEPCTVACECEPGWVGADCSLTAAQLQARMDLRQGLLTTFADSLVESDTTAESIDQQAEALGALTKAPDELTGEAQLTAMNVVDSLISRSEALVNDEGGSSLAPDTASTLLSVLAGLFTDAVSTIEAEAVDGEGDGEAAGGVGDDCVVGTAGAVACGEGGLSDENRAAALALAAQVRSRVDSIITAISDNAIPGQEPSEADGSSVALTVGWEEPAAVESLQTSGGNSFAFPPQTTSAAGGAPVRMVAVQWQNDPHVASTQLSTGVTTLRFDQPCDDPDGEVTSTELCSMPVEHLPEPIELCTNVPAGIGRNEFRCSFFDSELAESASPWASDGMVLSRWKSVAGTRQACCSSVHLTDFSGTEQETVISINSIDPVGDFGLLERYLDPESLMVLLVLSTLAGAMLISYIASLIASRRNVHGFRLAREVHFLHYGKFVKESFLTRPSAAHELPATLKDTTDARRRKELEAQAKELQRLIRQREEEQIRLKHATLPERLVLHAWWDFRDRFRRNHTWLNVFMAPLDERFQITRPQRVTILTATCLASMAATALLFGKDPKRTEAKVFNAFIASACMFPPEKIFPVLFRRANTLKSTTINELSRVKKGKKIAAKLAKKLSRGRSMRKVKGAGTPKTPKTPKSIKVSRVVPVTSTGTDAVAEEPAPAEKGVSKYQPIRIAEEVPQLYQKGGAWAAQANAASTRALGDGPDAKELPILAKSLWAPSGLTPLPGSDDNPVSPHARGPLAPIRTAGGAGGAPPSEAVVVTASSGSARVAPGDVGKSKDMNLVNLNALMRAASSDEDSDGGEGDDELDLLAFADKYDEDDSDSSEDGNPAATHDRETMMAALRVADGNPGNEAEQAAEGTEASGSPHDAKKAPEVAGDGVAMDDMAAAPTGARTVPGLNDRLNATQRLIARLTDRSRGEIWAAVLSLVMVYWGAVSLSGSAYIVVFFEARSGTAGIVGGNGLLLVVAGLVAYTRVNERGVRSAAWALAFCFACNASCFTLIAVTGWLGWEEVLYGLAVLQTLPIIALFVLLTLGFKALRKWGRAREVVVTPHHVATVEEEAEQRNADVHRAAGAVQRAFHGRKGRLRAVRRQEFNNWMALKFERTLLVGLSYGAILMFIAITFYINMIFGVKFTQEQSEAWVTASFIAFFIDLLLQQPLGFIMRGILVAFLFECRGGVKRGRVLEMGAEGGGANIVTVLT